MTAKEEHFDGKVAVKAVIEHKGKVLLVRDPREMKEIWEIPGGRMNVDEEPRTALAREVKEELGIDIEVHEVVHMEQFFQYSEGRNAFLITFRATLHTENLEFVLAPAEVAEVRWVSKDDTSSLKLFPEYQRSLEAYYKMTS